MNAFPMIPMPAPSLPGIMVTTKTNTRKTERWMAKMKVRREARYRIPLDKFPPLPCVRAGEIVKV